MNMTSDLDGRTEAGEEIPAGTVVRYAGHLPGAAVSVVLADGRTVVVHPYIFPELRPREISRRIEAARGQKGRGKDPAQD